MPKGWKEEYIMLGLAMSTVCALPGVSFVAIEFGTLVSKRLRHFVEETCAK